MERSSSHKDFNLMAVELCPADKHAREVANEPGIWADLVSGRNMGYAI